MGRKRIPVIEPKGSTLGCSIAFFVPSILFAVIAVYTGILWLLLFCIPAVWVILHSIRERLWLLHMYRSYQKNGVVGVLITSDSPNWSKYISENWIAHFGEKFVVLNWSRRKEWPQTVATKLFFRFCMHGKNRCPTIIYLQGSRYPEIYRFYYAFRDYKHGNAIALKEGENLLFASLGLQRNEE